MNNDLCKYLIPMLLPNSDEKGRMGKSKKFNTFDKVCICGADHLVEDKDRKLSFGYPTDYAILCGANVWYVDKNKKPHGDVLCRTMSKNGAHVDYLADKEDGFELMEYPSDENSSGISPFIQIDIAQALRDGVVLDPFKMISIRNKNFPCLRMGEFPQTYISIEDSLHKELNREFKKLENNSQACSLKKTGKKYPVWNEEDRLKYNVEYEYLGQKYVRVMPQLYDNYSRLWEDLNYNDAVWVKVEPIEWIIDNWEKLPRVINPLGNGEDIVMNLHTAKLIISGLPFHTNANEGDVACMWQNSYIRAYLNGYDLQHEILQKSNGLANYRSRQNYDFTRNKINFIDNAFDSVEVLEQNSQVAEEVIKHSRRKTQSRYGVSVPKTKLSIDDQIKYYIDNRRPVMLHGKSGIGKSRRVSDIDPDYFLLTLRNGMMPEEILGKECPNPSGAGTKWYAPSWYNELCEKCKEEPDKNHILFIDELTNVNEYEQSLVYHIVLNHSLGVTSGQLPENCVVVAAGNSKDESNSAYNMSEPLFRRFHGHIYLPLDIESLLEWGSESRKDNIEQTNLHPLISNYLATYSKSIYTEYDPDKEGKNYAIDPRAWEQVSDIIYDNNGELWEELITNKIGEENTTQLLAYAEKNFITIDDILADNYDEEEIPTKLDEQYALALCLRHANEQEIEKVREFICKNLSGETLAKFDFVWVGKNPERAMIIDDLQIKQKHIKSINREGVEHATRLSDKKIHIKDFCNVFDDWVTAWMIAEGNKEKMMIIHCDTEEKAKMLCKSFYKLGKVWESGESYTDTQFEGKDMCYSNWGTYGDIDDYDDVTTYDFYDVDFSGVLSKEEIDYIAGLETCEKCF